MTAPNTDLLACPFCGADAEIVRAGTLNTFVRCTRCRAASDDGSEGRVRAFWNRRTAASHEAEVARLRELLTPFAKAADAADEFDRQCVENGMAPMGDTAGPGLGITFGQLRRVRAALTPERTR